MGALWFGSFGEVTRRHWTEFGLQFFNQLGKNKEQYEIFTIYGHGLNGLLSLR